MAIFAFSEAFADEPSIDRRIPTVLIVETADMAFLKGQLLSVITYVKRYLPNHEYVIVRSRSLHAEIANKEIREDLAEKLTSRHLITHFYLGAHGETQEARTGYQTRLAGIGIIGEESVDLRFAQTFRTIQSLFSKSATIVLNSCSTFCGPEESVVLRARTLARYFGIENGTIYGSILGERGGLPSLRHSLRPKVLLIPAASGLSFGLGLGAIDPFLISHPFVLGAILGGAGSITSPIFHYLLYYVTAKSNQGKIVTIEAGEPVAIEFVRKLESAHRVFGLGRSCEGVFSF